MKPKRRCARKTTPAVAEAAQVANSANAAVEPAVDNASGHASELDHEFETAIRSILAEENLEKITLRKLRRDVVKTMGLPKKFKKRLEGPLRKEFAEMVERIVKDLSPSPKPEWWVLEDEDASTAVYLVTFAKILAETALVATTPLRTLDDQTRESIRDAIFEAVKKPVHDTRGGRPTSEPATVVKMVVAKEDPLHFHVALLLSKRVVFHPYKMALRQHSGLASHWSSSHREFWSTVRYLHFTTEHKQKVDDSKIFWTASGDALDYYKESQEPWTAKAYKAKREQAEAQACADVAAGKRKKGNHEGKFEKLDFMSLVLEETLDTPAKVLQYAQENGSAGMRSFVTRNQRRLAEFIADSHQWADAPAVAADERRSDWEVVKSLASQTCGCGNGLCQWWEAADDFFARNSETLDRQALASSLARVICEGPTKTSRVPLIVGHTNAAKSTVLTPIVKVFGFKNVVHRPGEKASMALANVTKANKRFIFWDEYRPVEFAARGTVPVGTFLSLFGGTPLEIQVSQSFHDGNGETLWRRGAAMTAKEEGLWDAIPPLPGLTPVTKEDIRHMQSRVEQHRATVPVPKDTLATVPDCKESWCRWVVVDASKYATGSPERPLKVRRLTGRALPALPGASGADSSAPQDSGTTISGGVWV